MDGVMRKMKKAVVVMLVSIGLSNACVCLAENAKNELGYNQPWPTPRFIWKDGKLLPNPELQHEDENQKEEASQEKKG